MRKKLVAIFLVFVFVISGSSIAFANDNYCNVNDEGFDYFVVRIYNADGSLARIEYFAEDAVLAKTVYYDVHQQYEADISRTVASQSSDDWRGILNHGIHTVHSGFSGIHNRTVSAYFAEGHGMIEMQIFVNNSLRARSTLSERQGIGLVSVGRMSSHQILVSRAGIIPPAHQQTVLIRMGVQDFI